MNRPLTRFGWTAQDDARAARIRAERGVLVFDEVDPGPWRRDLTPYLAAGADVTADGVQVTYYRPRAVFSGPAVQLETDP